MSAEKCGAQNTVYDCECGRAKGHEGSHVEFLTGATISWPQTKGAPK